MALPQALYPFRAPAAEKHEDQAYKIGCHAWHLAMWAKPLQRQMGDMMWQPAHENLLCTNGATKQTAVVDCMAMFTMIC